MFVFQVFTSKWNFFIPVDIFISCTSLTVLQKFNPKHERIKHFCKDLRARFVFFHIGMSYEISNFPFVLCSDAISIYQ